MDPSRINQVKHLYEVEHLTMRQIARELRMCHKTVSRSITGKKRLKKAPKPLVLAPYLRLIEEVVRKAPLVEGNPGVRALAGLRLHRQVHRGLNLHEDLQKKTRRLP